MTWNYRIIRHKQGFPGEPFYYAMHECYYDSSGQKFPHSCTVNPVQPISDTPEGMLWVLSKMIVATDKPVLEEGPDGKLCEVKDDGHGRSDQEAGSGDRAGSRD